jgi:cell volume regulation protein A
MNLTTENILLIGSILLIISVFAGKTSYRFGVPTLVFFMGVGMLAGSEGIGGIQFDDPKTTQFIGNELDQIKARKTCVHKPGNT